MTVAHNRVGGHPVSTTPLRPATTYPAVFGRILVQERTRCGLNQADVAAAVGLTQSGWSRIERGATPITLVQLAAASSSLGRRPSDLLSMADDAVDHLQHQGVDVAMHSTELEDPGGKVLIGVAALMGLVGLAIAAAASVEPDRPTKRSHRATHR